MATVFRTHLARLTLSERGRNPMRTGGEEWQDGGREASRDDSDRDPHADRVADQKTGRAPDREMKVRSAYDFKAVHRALADIPDDELKRVPVLREGERLRQGATYLDLFQGRRGEFRATVGMAAGPSNAYVAKDQVAHGTWNRLRGVDPGERT